MTEKIDGYWFSSGDRLLHGDNRLIVLGETHSLDGNIVLCENALHASRDPFDALGSAPGPYLYRVRCWGDVVEVDDKLGARHREYIAMHDATNMLHRSAREQALSVIHLWKPPTIVTQYLETGDETIRDVAWDVAWAAAGATVWDAAGAPVWAAARDAARAAVYAAVRAAAAKAAARDAARDAAWDTAWDATRNRFRELVAELFDGSAG